MYKWEQSSITSVTLASLQHKLYTVLWATGYVEEEILVEFHQFVASVVSCKYAGVTIPPKNDAL